MIRRFLIVVAVLSALSIFLATPVGAQATTTIAAATTQTTVAPAPGAATAAATTQTTVAPLFSETTQTNQRTATTPTDGGTFGQPPTTVDPGVLVFQSPVAPIDDSNKVSITVGDNAKPSQSVLIILLLTLLSLAPSILILLTSFTRIAIVLSLVRNAIGLQSIPPNQVIVGLAVFLSLFVMRPTFEQINNEALQPLLKNEITQGEAYTKALTPLRAFMLKQTGTRELKMMMAVSKEKKPATPKDVSNATLIPAFILSELRIAFIIGFIIFIPFLVIDLVVSSSLMSMGMMMLPPVVISLPFKLLLFVLVDGWSVIVKSLIESFL
jgi:flagellar biosynthesis protein FliP